MTSGLESIVPYVRPIEGLLYDASVSEIMRNGDGKWFAERGGRIEYLPDIQITETDVLMAVTNIARVISGTDVNDNLPLFDGCLPDGSRVAAIWPSVTLQGAVLNIRKFDSRRFDATELVRLGSVSPEAMGILAASLSKQHNVLISGGTSSGKTTLLNALSLYLGPVRVALIEDTAELQLHQSNVIRMIARRDPVPVTIRDLLRMAMRLRPDRIIVGEVRGGEAFELLNSLNSGHGGSMATIHAETARRAVSKLAMYALQAGEVPLEAIDAMIGESIHVIVQLQRTDGRRYVSEIVSLEGYDRDTRKHVFSDLWRTSGQDSTDVCGAHVPA